MVKAMFPEKRLNDMTSLKFNFTLTVTFQIHCGGLKKITTQSLSKCLSTYPEQHNRTGV